MTKSKPDKKSVASGSGAVDGRKKHGKKSSQQSSSEDEEEEATSSTTGGGGGGGVNSVKKTLNLSSSEATGSSSSGSSSGSSSTSSSSDEEDEEVPQQTQVKVVEEETRKSKGPQGTGTTTLEGKKSKSKMIPSVTTSSTMNSSSTSSSSLSKPVSNGLGKKGSLSIGSSTTTNNTQNSKLSHQQNSTKKKSSKGGGGVGSEIKTPVTPVKGNSKKDKDKITPVTKAPAKGTVGGKAGNNPNGGTGSNLSNLKKKSVNGLVVTPPGKKMPVNLNHTNTKSSSKHNNNGSNNGKISNKTSSGKSATPKQNGGKVQPKKHLSSVTVVEAVVASKKNEKKLEVSSSSSPIIGVVTRRGSRSTSCSSSASQSASSSSSSSDSSSESSNESIASIKSNLNFGEDDGGGGGGGTSTNTPQTTPVKPKQKSRLSTTSTSTSSSGGSGSSSSSSSEDEDDLGGGGGGAKGPKGGGKVQDNGASEKTTVTRAPPSLPAKTKTSQQNRISKRDEVPKKVAVAAAKNSRKKPSVIAVASSSTSSSLTLESKLIKMRSSSSCSSSAERSSAGSTTSSSTASARSRGSQNQNKKKRRGRGLVVGGKGPGPGSLGILQGPSKTELSIATCIEESNVPDIIQKHWQQIPRVKAKPPASTTFIIPSQSSEDIKGLSSKEDNETETETSSRPVTRRQISKVKKSNKTIPTTTKFSLDKLHEKLELGSSCSPRVVYNEASDSDYSCGSGGDNQVFIRCVPAKSSSSVNRKIIVEDNRVCMFPGCDSNGHLSGLYDKHCLISCCPKYHIDSGFFLGRGEDESRTEDADPGSGDELGPKNPAEECQQLSRMRSNRMTARSHYTPASSNPLTLIPTSNHQKLFKNPNKHHPQPQEVKQWISKMKELKDTKLDSNTSEYDMSLWRDALALAAAQIESEQNTGVQFNKWSLAMGKFEMGCWCCNPYPEPLAQLRRIFICEFCLKPVQSGTVLRRHCAKCVWRHPPGDEIYRKDRLSVWEVDGKTQKTYCQYLCLLAKCFLDHKTLYLDVDPFLFYVMTMADSQGCHIVGYFSKEKNSFLNYNVSCILTLPPYMRQGFGRLLIDFSYLLTRVEGKIGSPEKPLSDLGLISYRSYWKDAVLRRMCACASRDVSIKELSQELGISSADLVSTLQFLGMLKYWKGKHLILKKQDVLEEYLDRVRRRGVEQRQIDSSCLRWRPYQPPPDNSQNQEEQNSTISSILNSVVSGGGGGGGGTTD